MGLNNPPAFVTQETVELLRLAFPNRCPRPDATDREIWIAVGAVKVIDHLQRLVNSANPQRTKPNVPSPFDQSSS